jgi:hypothetical protein
MLDHFGRNLGLFVASTGKRVQQVAAVRGKGEPSKSFAGKKRGRAASASTEEDNQEAIERADVLVEQMEARVSHFTQRASFGFQKTTARLREEVEDMWAEAQHLRQQHRH